LPTAVVKFLQDLQDCRYYTFLYVSIWKIVCFFCTMLVATHFQFGSLGVEDLFNLFSETFSPRNITVTEVRTTFTDIQENKIFV
jgi:chitin synthase